jgi:hypothetical protein
VMHWHQRQHCSHIQPPPVISNHPPAASTPVSGYSKAPSSTGYFNFIVPSGDPDTAKLLLKPGIMNIMIFQKFHH